MIGAIVITHGGLAEALVDVADTIAGGLEAMVPLSVGRKDSSEELIARVEEAISRVDSGKGVIIFTDMFGGTPTNIALTFLEEGRVEVVAGVNLPLILKFINKREEMSFSELVEKLCEEGRRSIVFASKMLKGKR